MCIYQCINNELRLAESDCPAKPCPDPGGPCYNNGDIIITPCPPPFGGSDLTVEDE